MEGEKIRQIRESSRLKPDNQPQFNGSYNPNCSSADNPQNWKQQEAKLLKKFEKQCINQARYRSM
jgi:hypothetical protein